MQQTAPLANKKKSFWQTLFKQHQLLLMSLPFVLYIILFKFVPLWGWNMAFQNYKPNLPFSRQQWVGFAKFAFLFKDKEFLLSLRNTICMSLISTALGFVTAIFIALLLNEVHSTGIKRFTQTVSYLPHFLSWIIVTSLVANVLSVEDGILNNLLMFFGIIDKPGFLIHRITLFLFLAHHRLDLRLEGSRLEHDRLPWSHDGH